MFTDADLTADHLRVEVLGEARFPSPLRDLLRDRRGSSHYVDEDDRVLLDDTRRLAVDRDVAVADLPSFEPGGPRSELYFDPAGTRVGVVTCGGLCPGLNNVIRGLVLELVEHYGVQRIVGYRNGYRGLVGADGLPPMWLDPQVVGGIHRSGGTILGTSRGSQDAEAMVEVLVRDGISILFVVGGDGTLRGAGAIAAAARARGADLAVVGVPKTIDNDIPYIDHSFGFQTAFGRAADSIRSAHVEAGSTPGGVGLVKLMGRHSGFIACYAALADHDADVVLVPEVPFTLAEVVAEVRDLLRRQGHAVVVVAEGAGPDLGPGQGTDASGNAKLGDIGGLLRDTITAELAGQQLSLRYVDPGYAIRSVAANP